MSAVPCYVSQAENKAGARIEQRLANYEAARTLLANEFVNAFRAGADAKVSTPGFNKRAMPIGEVLHDSFSDADGEKAISDLFEIINAGIRGELVKHRLMGWVADRASKHAEFHADDLAEQIGGDQ
jgi:hypothetical protein